jgi:hypothetical protein
MWLVGAVWHEAHAFLRAPTPAMPASFLKRWQRSLRRLARASQPTARVPRTMVLVLKPYVKQRTSISAIVPYKIFFLFTQGLLCLNEPWMIKNYAIISAIPPHEITFVVPTYNVNIPVVER